MATTVKERPIVSSHARKDAALAAAEQRFQPSYVSGASTQPLLGESIGATFDRTIERFGDREALVSCHQGLRYSYAELAAAVEEAGARAAGHRPCAGRAGRDLGARTAPSGRSCSSPPPSWGSFSSTSIRPTGRRSSSSRCASPAAGRWSPRGRSRALTTSRWSTRSAPKVPALERVVFLDGPDWDALLAGAARGEPRRGGRAPGRDAVRRPDQHPVHAAAPPAFPRAATLSHHNILNNGYFVGARLRVQPRRTGSASPCPSTTASAWSWATWRRSRTAPAWSSRRPAFDAVARPRDRAAGALHRRSTACRRCSSPSSSTSASRSSSSPGRGTGIDVPAHDPPGPEPTPGGSSSPSPLPARSGATRRQDVAPDQPRPDPSRSPTRTPRWVTASTASPCTGRVPTCCSCRSTGT